MPKRPDALKLAVCKMAFKAFRNGDSLPEFVSIGYRLPINDDTELLVRVDATGPGHPPRYFRIKVTESA